MFLRLADKVFAVPLSSIREVLGLGQLSGLPNMPNYFAGLINLRGKIVSTLDLKKSLGFINDSASSDHKTKRPCIVITEISGRLFGALVDDVTEVQAIDPKAIEASVEGLQNQEVFAGVIKRDQKPLAPVLNLERALRINELIELENNKAS